MWFFNQYDAGSGTYNVPIAIRLRGELNVDALRSAMIDVLDRHESLRTRYPDHDGMLIQLIEPVDRDRELTPVSVPPNQLVSAVTEFVTEGFDVSTRVPVRAQLFRIADAQESEYVLALVVHHIAADGFSMTLLARDVATAYTARIRGEAPSWDSAAHPVRGLCTVATSCPRLAGRTGIAVRPADSILDGNSGRSCRGTSPAVRQAAAGGDVESGCHRCSFAGWRCGSGVGGCCSAA